MRLTSERMPFLSCLMSALQPVVGVQGGARPLWPSPSQAMGTPATYDKAEISRARALRTDALGAAGVTAPPKRTYFADRDSDFG